MIVEDEMADIVPDILGATAAKSAIVE